MTETEAQTRQDIIHKRLNKAGWNVKDLSRKIKGPGHCACERIPFDRLIFLLVRGIPTGYAAPPLVDLIMQPNEPPPVWPYVNGEVRGNEFSPLYKSVPMAAARDNELYELLTLIDAIRDGRAREKNLAIKELRTRLRVK